MREIQALDPTVDPDQAIRTPCAPAAPAVPKAPAAPATPAAAQALKLTDAAARLGEALCGVPTERNPSTHPYPGLHPGLVCRAPLGHPLESSTALSRPVEATPMNYQRPYLGSLRHCSLLSGDRLCVRGGAGLRDRLLGVGGSRVGLRGIEPALAGRLGGRALLSRCARGGWVIASNARFGSVPLLPGDRLVLGGRGEGQAAGRDRLLGGHQLF